MGHKNIPHLIFIMVHSYVKQVGHGEISVIVTGFEKTLCMGFFKLEFNAWLISSRTELTHVQVLGRSLTLLRYSALFGIAPHPQ